MRKKISTYEEIDTLGKSQVELIVKVYDGALSSLETARQYYTGENWSLGYEELERARKFVVHLYSTLDFTAGGEIAANLGRMYVFLLGEFDAIEATKNMQHLDSCITVLKNLRSGWDGLRDSEKKTGPHLSNQNAAAINDNQSIVMTA